MGRISFSSPSVLLGSPSVPIRVLSLVHPGWLSWDKPWSGDPRCQQALMSFIWVSDLMWMSHSKAGTENLQARREEEEMLRGWWEMQGESWVWGYEEGCHRGWWHLLWKKSTRELLEQLLWRSLGWKPCGSNGEAGEEGLWAGGYGW